MTLGDTAPLRLIYLSNTRLPSEKANALQSMRQCEALGRRVNVEFWHPRRHNPMSGDVFRFYGISPTFALRTLRCVDLSRWSGRPRRLSFLLQTVTFQFTCLWRLVRAPRAVVYTRNSFDILLAPLLRVLRPDIRVFFEDHDGIGRGSARLKRALLRAMRGIVVTTSMHAARLREIGYPASRILVAANAVDLDRFAGLPIGRPAGGRIVYVGNLFPWKGVFTLVDALKHLPSEYQLDIVGGSPELRPAFDAHVAKLALGDRVRCVGPVAPGEVPRHLAGATVVVLPNSGARELSSELTSPLKLFEYMASGAPIVGTNVASLREVLEHDRNAWLVVPDDSSALADGIRRVAEDPVVGSRLARAAKDDVTARTWDARAARILDFVRGELS